MHGTSDQLTFLKQVCAGSHQTLQMQTTAVVLFKGQSGRISEEQKSGEASKVTQIIKGHGDLDPCLNTPGKG